MYLRDHNISLCKENYLGAALEVSKHERMINHLVAFVDIDIHTSQKYIFNTSVLFK